MAEKEVYTCKVEDVIVPTDRIRKEFDKEKLRELAMSFKARGQLQPGICRHGENGEVILIAGERRLKACEMAEIDYQYILNEVDCEDTYEIKRIEYEENYCRANLSWQEESDAILMFHRLQQSQFGETSPGVRGGYGERNTADDLGISLGKVHENLKLAMFAREREDVRQAKSRTEAKKIIKRLEETVDRHEKMEELKKNEESGISSDDPVETQLRYFKKKVICGEMEKEILSFPEESFQIVCFDPPWRVGIDSVRKKGGNTSDFEDAKLPEEEFYRELKSYLGLIEKRMDKNSHLYMFFGIVNHKLVYDCLEEVGFTTNRIPLIWHKSGAHVVRTPDVWPGRSYEPIAFARKGSKKIVRPGSPDVITTPAPTPAMKRSHPTAKHPDIYLEVLRRSAWPGDKVLDPMAGSGMMGVAAETLSSTHKLDWYEIEKSKDFSNLCIINATRGYSAIVQEKIVEDFKSLEPGSPEWEAYWKDHPDDQPEMLKWREEKKK